MNQIPIKLNDLLQMTDLENVKIRMLTTYSNKVNPLDHFRNNDNEELMKWLFWNYSKQKSYKVGESVIGLLRLEGDKWLLFSICTVTRDLNQFDGPGYEYCIDSRYEQFFGRVIVAYENKAQKLIRKASGLLDECIVSRIIEGRYEDEEFPGYDKINISWAVMSRVLGKSSWKTALQNQKGVYLITDVSTGKMYVGSAYGENMLLGRWQQYLNTGHGGNEGLKELDFDYIKKNFRYSVLDIFKSTIDDDVIISRESWWKETLLSRTFGYNKN